MRKAIVILLLVVGFAANAVSQSQEPAPFSRAKMIAFTQGKVFDDGSYMFSAPQGFILYHPRDEITCIQLGNRENGHGVCYMLFFEGGWFNKYIMNRSSQGKGDAVAVDAATAYELAKQYLKELGL